MDSDAGSYTVTVSNAISAATSSPPVMLTVIDPPMVTGQPTSITNNAGTTATFTAQLSGSPAILAWYQNGTNLLTNGANISGATSNELILSNVLGADSGSYTLVASNFAGVATTMVATLTVIDPIILAEPSSLTNEAGTTATFAVSAYGTAPGYQWYYNGTNIPGATATNYSITNVADANQGSYTVIVSNAYGVVTSAPPATLTVIDPILITAEPSNQTVGAGTNASFSVGVTGTAPIFQWYKGATPLTDNGHITGSQTSNLMVMSAVDGDAGGYSVVISNLVTSATSTPPATLTVIDPPVIMLQPIGMTNAAGTTATFVVSNLGSPSTYEWYLNSTNALADGGQISGVTTPVLTISNLLAANDGSYSVKVQNLARTVTSSNALLVVLDPYITAQPNSTINQVGTTVTFSVTAVGTLPLSYQWFFGNFPLADETNRTLVLTDVADSDDGNYYVVVSNSVGSVTSATAALVTFPPLIVSQPVGGYVFLGQSFSFEVGVNGETPFVYQWQQNGTNLPGATQRILTIPSATFANAGPYDVLVSNPQGSETSEDALLTVTGDPVLQIINFSNQTATVEVNWYNGSNAVLQSSEDLSIGLQSIPIRLRTMSWIQTRRTSQTGSTVLRARRNMASIGLNAEYVRHKLRIAGVCGVLYQGQPS